MRSPVASTQSQSIADLPDIAKIIPDWDRAGIPEEFSNLFARPTLRLVRNGEKGVIVFRNKDLLEAAANPALGNSPVEGALEFLRKDAGTVTSIHLERLIRNQIFNINPQDHIPKRQVLTRTLTPKWVSTASEIAKRVVSRVMGEVPGHGVIDFHLAISERVTARFWGELFEMTDLEVKGVTESVRGMTPLFFFERTPAQTSDANTATGQYLDLVGSAIDRALERGRNELLNSMAAALGGADLKSRPDSIGVWIASNLFDAFHTTAVASTNVAYLLLINPEAMAAVQANRSLIGNALAEGLRLCTPILMLNRCALSDLELAGVTIPSATPVGMLWAAGNRDPAVYENPNRYDLLRKQRSNTTFGGGVHICPGRYLAQMLVREVLEGILSPDFRVELTESGLTWTGRSIARQLNRMPISIKKK